MNPSLQTSARELQADRSTPPAREPAPLSPVASRPRRRWVASVVLVVLVLAVAAALAAWKRSALAAEEALAASMPEPAESVTAAVVGERAHQRTTTSIGTVLALRSITLRNEIAGTVSEVGLVPGAVVEEGAVLIAFDASVEEAELAAQEAQAALAETQLARVEKASQGRGASQSDVDRARAERDVARATVARTNAMIAKHTIRAPFRARVGMADVHRGQYLDVGTELTTLQGVDEAVDVDFTVPQAVAAALAVGGRVDVVTAQGGEPVSARIEAIDARVDPRTRNAWVRARVSAGAGVTPGASVRVLVPVGPETRAASVPVAALRKGPQGDHVFVLVQDASGATRAQRRAVETGAVVGGEVLIESGLAAGEKVAATGSFKLRDGALVVVAEDSGNADGAPTAGRAGDGAGQR